MKTVLLAALFACWCASCSNPVAVMEERVQDSERLDNLFRQIDDYRTVRGRWPTSVRDLKSIPTRDGGRFNARGFRELELAEVPKNGLMVRYETSIHNGEATLYPRWRAD